MLYQRNEGGQNVMISFEREDYVKYRLQRANETIWGNTLLNFSRNE